MDSEFYGITVGQLLDRTASLYPDTEALVYNDRGIRLTYAEFKQVCEQAAKGFMKLGVKKGDHIAIWATNYPQWVISQFATGKMGAVLVTVNTNYRVFELEYLLKNSDSSTLILMPGVKDSAYIDMIYELCPELNHCEPGKLESKNLPWLKNVIFLGDKKYPGMFTWEEVMELGNEVSDEDLLERQFSLSPDEVINMQYTSGTTGFPKGVMLTHQNIVVDASLIAASMRFTNKDRLCIPVPFFHCFGCVLGTMACVTAGTTMVPVERFDALKVMQTLEAEKCTAVHGVPTMFIAMLEHPDFSCFDFSSLRTGIMAGSPCPIEVMRAVVDKMGASEITIAYGLTEASPVITQTTTEDPIELRVTTVGRPFPIVQVKIIDPETGAEVPRNTPGELCVKGLTVMKGYYKMPEATAMAIDADGWLHSGDLATMDDNGYCKITGRVKDMIIRGGENIYPREIEEFFYTHPKVSDVQVVGVPDRKYGEEVIAFIKLKEGEIADEEELKTFARDKISRFKIPRYIRFVDSFPMTASGKIQKFKLREKAIKELGLEADAQIETA